MGVTTSHCAGAPATPPPPSPAVGSVPGQPGAPPVGLQQVLGEAEKLPPIPDDKTDYLDLPTPVKFDEIQREALMALKPELFEGLRFEFNKPLNQKFSLSHSIFMGSQEVPQSPQVVKVPTSTYEFGANVLDPEFMLIGRLLNDGRLNARVNWAMTQNLAVKVHAQLTSEPHFSQAMFQFDYKGSDYQTQLQLGNNAFYGANYIQSVTPNLALGGEVFWLGHQRRSGIGCAARYNDDKAVASLQAATTGMVVMSYVQRASEKVALAAELNYNWNSKEATTSVGYDYVLRQCRLRGRIDTNGVVAAYLEERLNVGVNLLFSAEVDHWKKDYKFGFGMTVGE